MYVRLQVTNKCSVEPIFVLDGVTYCFIQSSKMYFVLTTVKNMQCTMLVELLCRLSRVFKDYCGHLSLALSLSRLHIWNK